MWTRASRALGDRTWAVAGFGGIFVAVVSWAVVSHRALGHVIGQVRALPAPWWPPVLFAVAAVAFSYWCSAVGLRAAAGRPLPMRRTLLVQLAAATANRLTPGGVGGAAVNARFLTRHGLSGGRAGVAVSLSGVAHAVVAVAGISLVAPAAGLPHVRSFGVAACLVGGLSFAAIRAIQRSARANRHLASVLRDIAAALAEAAHEPHRLATLVLAAAAVKASNLVALAALTRAFDGDIPTWRVAVVYLVGVPLAEAIPTPGGLGTVDAMLVVGLTPTGVAVPAVVAAVVVFRLITFWGPIVPGALASGILRRRCAL